MSISKDDLYLIKSNDIISVYRIHVDDMYFITDVEEGGEISTFEAKVLYVYSEEEKNKYSTNALFISAHKIEDCSDGWLFDINRIFSEEEKNAIEQEEKKYFQGDWKSKFKLRRYFLSSFSKIDKFYSSYNKEILTGETCIECTKFSKWSEPNLINGKFACFSCRDSMKWKYNNLLIK